VTREAWVKWARARYESLAAISAEAADEARTQAGLPEVWSWTSLRAQDAYRLSITCQIRLLDV